MASYDDMLKEANDILYMGKYKDATNAACKPWNQYTFNVKAAPKAGMKVEHEMSVDNDGEKENQTTLGWKSGDAEFEAGMSGDSMSLQVGMPVASGDWKADATVKVQGQVQKERSIEGKLEVESPDMSGTKTKFEIGFEEKRNFLSDAWVRPDPKLHFNMCAYNYANEVQIGASIEHDTKDVLSSEVQLVKQDQLNKYWFGWNHSNRVAKGGCFIYNAEKNFKHAYEARYNVCEGSVANIAGLPLSFTACGTYELSDASSMGYSVTKACGNWVALTQFQHQLNKNLEMTAHQSFQFKEKQPYHLGLDFTYKI